MEPMIKETIVFSWQDPPTDTYTLPYLLILKDNKKSNGMGDSLKKQVLKRFCHDVAPDTQEFSFQDCVFDKDIFDICHSQNGLVRLYVRSSVFSVTRRSRSDESHSLTN